MYTTKNGTTSLSGWIKKEVKFERKLQSGSRGMAVKRVQEWLNLSGCGLVIDGQYGPVTSRNVELFQLNSGLQVTGVIDNETFAKLVEPMSKTLGVINDAGDDFGSLALRYANAHLVAHPMETGGQNCGPWVRLYMKGNHGTQWAWCAGFITFVLNQAAETLGVSMPIQGSFSCDSLAAQANQKGLFLAERDVDHTELPEGSVFLVRRTHDDWTHTGIVSKSQSGVFDTVEGNTNDDGNREGYELCARSRGFSDKDFIVF